MRERLECQSLHESIKYYQNEHWLVEKRHRKLDERTKERTNERANEWINECTNEWMNERMNEVNERIIKFHCRIQTEFEQCFSECEGPGAVVKARQRARPQTAMARIWNSVSGRRCHLIHPTILRRLSWPSLAYMCKTPFIYFHLCHQRRCTALTITSRGYWKWQE